MRFLVRALDKLIRKQNGVFEFTQDESCLLRLQIAPAPHTLRLPDLTVEAGDQVLLLHLWNEHLFNISRNINNLVWVKHKLSDFYHSLHMVADYLQVNPQGVLQMSDAQALGGATILVTAGLHEAGVRLVQRLGFTVMPYANPLGRFGEFWENFYSWMLIWTFNPGSLPSRSIFQIRRLEIWISRGAFLERFSEPPADSSLQSKL